MLIRYMYYTGLGHVIIIWFIYESHDYHMTWWCVCIGSSCRCWFSSWEVCERETFWYSEHQGETDQHQSTIHTVSYMTITWSRHHHMIWSHDVFLVWKLWLSSGGRIWMILLNYINFIVTWMKRRPGSGETHSYHMTHHMTIMWHRERRLLMSGDNYGRGLVSVQNLIKKHSLVESELTSHQSKLEVSPVIIPFL